MKDLIQKAKEEFRKSVIAISALENIHIDKTLSRLIANNFEHYSKQAYKAGQSSMLLEEKGCRIEIDGRWHDSDAYDYAVQELRAKLTD